MVNFLLSFSDSFLFAILSWPFVAFLITLPIFIMQYRKYNKLIALRAIGVYGFILYCLSLISFTLYPMPDNAVEFCKMYDLSPQFMPIRFISDISTDGLRALLQVVMNMVFFIPLGVFGRLLFGIRLKTMALVALFTSLFIESAQLTGGFGIYPCSYRLFDIDDLMLNVAGALIGYGIARLVPHKELGRGSMAPVKQPGIFRRLVAFSVDYILSLIISIVVLLSLYFILGKDTTMHIRDYVLPTALAVVFGAMPCLAKGWTMGGLLARLNYDDRDRLGLRRLMYYLLRLALVFGIVYPLAGSGVSQVITICITAIIWWRFHKLPYQFV